MAIKLVINVSKKIPGPTDYSSVQASCSIECECASGDPVADSAQLYSQAELAVDAQLGLKHDNTNGSKGIFPDFTNDRPVIHQQSRINGNGRKAPPATESQLRLLKMLMGKDPIKSDAILAYFNVGHINDLDIPQASEAIDQLKAKA